MRKLFALACGLLASLAAPLSSCTTARTKPAYYFKPGPAYQPGPKQYPHPRYPTHP
ncbi:hypothetical protein JAO73_10450 [Hymenobacter sp. BT523]|uniref:hypothetical protein n=1 Tax=Hymenobacter sp. BT523 TaxID=2795725 RepID=UPI0018EB21DC|nr:hypothetical protein [Hymenobacter sp. BT523]MBJ6109435.1 hypothetical protein [Hymenobacter sp. BT523]